ncbi:alpha/Beta hydrolase fold protein [Artemisia annua]|uniref:Alpha/Beta hydrolase fold protein n=1 Tax=Artemisia annua TaxID=35608 RepID=A0A2U1M5V6_ARTAN|nr:alpha/Beta hydrolase fold protein [Artemisia annua]
MCELDELNTAKDFRRFWKAKSVQVVLFVGDYKGKNVDLCRESPDFSSIIGLADVRLDLDDEISNEDRRYYSALAIMASKIAYENEARVKKIVNDKWKMEHIGFYNCSNGLQKCNERYAKWPKEIEEDKQNGHTFAYYKIRELLREKLKKNKNVRFMVTGHSLGGALAVLFPAILAFHKEFELLERLDGVYTFGQPRVGDDNFCRFMEDLGVNRYFRFVYANDIVPIVPFDNSDFGFKHFGNCYHFNSFYNGQVVKEVHNKNYVSKKLALAHLNAVFELVRSLALPYLYGRKYKEGLLLMKVRLFGLIFPGASTHCPQDYVNLTRLASRNFFYSLNYNYTEVEIDD